MDILGLLPKAKFGGWIKSIWSEYMNAVASNIYDRVCYFSKCMNANLHYESLSSF